MIDKVQESLIEKPSALQLLDFSNDVGKAVCRYLISGNITKERFAKIKGSDIDEISKKIAHKLLQLVPDETMAKKELIERFYLEVFSFKVDLTKVVFPEKEGFTAFGYNTRKFDVDQITAAYVKKWSRNVYKYLKPATKNIKHQQARPKGPYAFTYRGGDEPDAEHLNKSFDGAMTEGFPFANADEYLLMTGLYMFITDSFMDLNTETIISSLWPDGIFVVGKWSKAYSQLWLTTGSFHDNNVRSMGPRELFLA